MFGLKLQADERRTQKKIIVLDHSTSLLALLATIVDNEFLKLNFSLALFLACESSKNDLNFPRNPFFPHLSSSPPRTTRHCARFSLSRCCCTHTSARARSDREFKRESLWQVKYTSGVQEDRFVVSKYTRKYSLALSLWPRSEIRVHLVLYK